MRTLIIYNDCENDLQYTILEGDYSRFHNLFIGSNLNTEVCDEFCKMFFDEVNGNFLIELCDNIKLIEEKNWDKIAIVTFLP